jgi:hypothetical protein
VGARFPDLWLARVIERSRAAFVLGLTIALALVGVGGYNACQLCASAPGLERPAARVAAPPGV